MISDEQAITQCKAFLTLEKWAQTLDVIKSKLDLNNWLTNCEDSKQINAVIQLSVQAQSQPLVLFIIEKNFAFRKKLSLADFETIRGYLDAVFIPLGLVQCLDFLRSNNNYQKWIQTTPIQNIAELIYSFLIKCEEIPPQLSNIIFQRADFFEYLNTLDPVNFVRHFSALLKVINDPSLVLARITNLHGLRAILNNPAILKNSSQIIEQVNVLMGRGQTFAAPIYPYTNSRRLFQYHILVPTENIELPNLPGFDYLPDNPSPHSEEKAWDLTAG